MKNIARLVLFFSITFVSIFLAAAAARYINLWIDALRMIPARTSRPLTALFDALQWALPGAVYGSLLLSLGYAARQGVPIPRTMACLFLLGVLFTAGMALGLVRIRGAGAVPATEAHASLGEPGLILFRGDTAIVLLDESGKELGSRVVALPGRSLVYQELPIGSDNRAISLPPAPFREQPVNFITTVRIDLALVAEQFDSRLGEGLIPFAVYVAALMFLLVSLRVFLDLSVWPLANLLLGALMFRVVLALETLMDSREILSFIAPFLGKWIDPAFMSPLLFSGLGLLIMLYSALASFAGGRRR
ncbi:MAG: hypothetical protein LBD78_10120 [Spirochaetaceae bacterium]|nr:hypothetical protein [Spirochaetaceae bacterium]